MRVQTWGMSILHEFQMSIFPLLEVYDHMVGHAGARSSICIAHTDVTLTWSKVKVTDLLKFRKLLLYVYLLLFWRGAHNWWVITIVRDLVYSFSELYFWISPPVGGHVTSKFAKYWYHQNSLRFISALGDARSLWLWLRKPQQGVHPGDDHRQPLAGLFMVALCNRADHYIFAL